jgi:uncharacterized protein (TIGR01370 family)
MFGTALAWILAGGYASSDPSANEPPSQSRSAPSVSLGERLRDGFGVQYWGPSYTADQLAEAPHGVLILEATRLGPNDNPSGREVRFTPEEIETISRGGSRPVLGYLNVVEIETYRDYWADTAFVGLPARREWMGPSTSEQEQLALFWTEAWEKILLERVDDLMAIGLQGIFLDDVLHYYTYASTFPTSVRGLPWPAKPADFACEMMDLVIRLSERARSHREDAFIIVNNGVFIGYDAEESENCPQFDAYLSAINAILVEDLFSSLESGPVIDALQSQYQARGVPVLVVEFATNFPQMSMPAVQRMVQDLSVKRGLFPYVVQDEKFNRLFHPFRVQAEPSPPG